MKTWQIPVQCLCTVYPLWYKHKWQYRGFTRGHHPLSNSRRPSLFFPSHKDAVSKRPSSLNCSRIICIRNICNTAFWVQSSVLYRLRAVLDMSNCIQKQCKSIFSWKGLKWGIFRKKTGNTDLRTCVLLFYVLIAETCLFMLEDLKPHTKSNHMVFIKSVK